MARAFHDRGEVLSSLFIRARQRSETSHSLADLMLPDGAHLRSEDWTTFYLRAPTTASISQTGPVNGESEEDGRLSTSEREKEEGKLLFVINLVRTKKDDTVKRCVSCFPAKEWVP